MTRHVYARCMDGHYFTGRVCALDGFESDASVATATILIELGNREASIAALLDAGFPSALLGEIVIVEQEWPDWPPVLPLEFLD